MTNPGEVVNDPIQLANMLKTFAELRQSNAILENEYERLKTRLLAAMERRIPSEFDLQPASPPAVPSSGIQDYAGEIHRLISEH
jgi:hypothetical protein